jgi:hypothetical protein
MTDRCDSCVEVNCDESVCKCECHSREAEDASD